MLDLHAQYETLLPQIRAAMDKVMSEHNYIMGHQ